MGVLLCERSDAHRYVDRRAQASVTGTIADLHVVFQPAGECSAHPHRSPWRCHERLVPAGRRSAKNKGLKGDAYKTAQSACLSGHATETKAATPQERMKQCNADAATKKLAGDARKTFMSSCLKAS